MNASSTGDGLSLQARALGSYLGLAVGDALGASVEFMTAREIVAEYGIHKEMTGGGWLQLRPGQITDDTQMCLALGKAILTSSEGWELRRVGDAFVAWLKSRPIDVGNTCRRGIRRYQQQGTLSAEPSPDHAGNGAAMRNLPIILSTLSNDEAFRSRSLAQAHLTHHHPLSDAAVILLGQITRIFLQGQPLMEGLRLAHASVTEYPCFRFRPWPGLAGGYIAETVSTVFDALFNTDSFEDCLVTAVNRGGDADTIGALAGQLAGALYGVDAIPRRWLRRLDPTVANAIRFQVLGLLSLESIPPKEQKT